MKAPDKTQLYPLQDYDKLCFLNNLIDQPNIKIGDYTYYDDSTGVDSFLSNVKYHFDFIGDQLIIGKFCSIAAGASFIMNGGNHLTTSISSYPFAIFGAGWTDAMESRNYPSKGDTIVGNDAWIGHNATIMPGVNIGDGAIIAAHAVVTKDVNPYTIVGGNPAKMIKKRFDESMILKLLDIKWWNWPIDRITRNVKNLTQGNLELLTE